MSLHFWAVLLLLPVESSHVVSCGLGEALGKKQRCAACSWNDRVQVWSESELVHDPLLQLQLKWEVGQGLHHHQRGCHTVLMGSPHYQSIRICKGKLRWGGEVVYICSIQFSFLRFDLVEKKERNRITEMGLESPCKILQLILWPGLPHKSTWRSSSLVTQSIHRTQDGRTWWPKKDKFPFLWEIPKARKLGQRLIWVG